jgi:hypothetical protein
MYSDETEPEQSTSDLLSDCRIMLRFARKEARTIPSECISDIAKLDSMLKKLRLPSVSGLPDTLIPDAEPAKDATSVSPTELILKIHGALSQIVAPATAQSLQVSEPPPGRHRFLGGMPMLVKAAAWIAVICALGFVLTSIPAAKDKFQTITGSSPSPTLTPTPTPTQGVTR